MDAAHPIITRNPDGSITRLQFPKTPAAPDADSAVLTKDLPVNPHHATWLRIFLPRSPDNPPPALSLPLILYFHGGGYVLGSADATMFHDFCSGIAEQAAAVVVSVGYRLAPEHRLPAAFDDAVEALHWVGRTEEEWIRRFADLTRCFLMGTSAGGGIAYRAGLSAAADGGGLEPLEIRGLILHQPFFGGSERMESEKRLFQNPTLPLSLADLMWELSLPAGADRDHEYSNPAADARFGRLGGLKRLGWRVVMTCGSEDPLVDRQAAAARMMEAEGIPVQVVLREGDCHGAEFMDPTKGPALFTVVRNFIHN